MSYREILQQLYTQNDLSSSIRLTAVQSNDELDARNKDGYAIPMTAQEWNNRFPDIPADKIICFKHASFFAPPLAYYDEEKYIFVDLKFFIPGQWEHLLEQTGGIDTIVNLIRKQEQSYKKRDYIGLLLPLANEASGNIGLEIVRNMLLHEKPNTKLYKAVISEYSFWDCGMNKIHDVLDKLLACKSSKQKAETAKKLEKIPRTDKGFIQIYRGGGAKSTSPEKAMSWTTSKSVAYFFCARAGAEGSYFATAQIAPDDVIEYVDDRNEEEIIVNPKALTSVSVLRHTSTDAFSDGVSDVSYGGHTVPVPEGCGYIDFLQEKIEEASNIAHEVISADTKLADHNEQHSINVALMTTYLCNKILYGEEYPDQPVEAIGRAAICAAIWHDAARLSDGADKGHGERAVAGLQEAYSTNRTFLENRKELSLAKFMVEYHDLPYEKALVAFKKRYDIPDNQDLMTDQQWQAFCILRDADALDRWRFGPKSRDFVDTDYLNFKESIELMGVATVLNE